MDSIRQRLGANPIAMQMPIGMEAAFQGVVDLMEMKAIFWDDELGREPREAEVPVDIRKEADERRHTMVERIAELDDKLTVKYLEGKKISNDELKSALRRRSLKARLHRFFVAVRCATKGCSWCWMQ